MALEQVNREMVPLAIAGCREGDHHLGFRAQQVRQVALEGHGGGRLRNQQRLARRQLARRLATESPFDQRQGFPGIEGAYNHQRHVARDVVAPVGAQDIVAADRVRRLELPAREAHSLQPFVVSRLADAVRVGPASQGPRRLAGLAPDDLARQFDVRRAQRGFGQDFVQQAEAVLEVPAEDVEFVDGFRQARRCVPRAAPRADLFVECRFTVTACTREQQVLEKVRGFAAAAGEIQHADLDPHADRHVARVAAGLQHDAQAVGEHAMLDFVETPWAVLVGARGQRAEEAQNERQRREPCRAAGKPGKTAGNRGQTTISGNRGQTTISSEIVVCPR